MRRIKAILGLLIILLVISALSVMALKPSSQIISYTRMYADDSGRSHFTDETINLEALSYVPNFKVTPFTQASSIGFFHAAESLDMSFHPAPRRQWAFILSGTLEVEVQDGEIRQFPSGSIILVEDTIGIGHKTRVVGGTAVFGAWVPVGNK